MGEDKDKMIRGVYCEQDNGFGSVNDTYKQSHRILNAITLNDVKGSLSKHQPRQTKHIVVLIVMWQKSHCKRYTWIWLISHALLK